jgi:N-acetyl-anhydromuramyl-L-alanine amidase AmpD
MRYPFRFVFTFILTALSLALLLGLSGMLNKTNNPNPDEMPSWVKVQFINYGAKLNHSGTPREISTLVIHSMYNPEVADSFSSAACLSLLKRYNVSAHFIIERQGQIIQLLPLSAISYHAGKSQMPDGRTGINQFSVGIELINSKYTEPTEMQYQSLFRLTERLSKRHPIRSILRHSDIAPGRKTDPWNFDWQRYAQIYPALVYWPTSK